MFALPILSVAVLLARFSTPVRAGYDIFEFSANATDFLCEGSGFKCPPPSVCSHDVITDQWYCCIPGADDAVCWKQSPTCDGDDAKKPSGGQQACSSGQYAFCCLRDREACTQTKDQINICWSTSPNPVANLSSDLFNKTYSSLLSASPSATALPIKLADFEPSTSTTAEPATSSASGASTASTATTTNNSASNTPSSTSSASAAAEASSSGLSGAAIASIVGGVVGGVVGGLALVGLIAFLLWRRRRAAAHEHAPIASSPQSDKGVNPYEMSAYDTAAHPPTEAPVTTKYGYRDEAYAHEAPSTGGYAAEVPAESRPVAYEMAGNAPAEMDASRR